MTRSLGVSWTERASCSAAGRSLAVTTWGGYSAVVGRLYPVPGRAKVPGELQRAGSGGVWDFCCRASQVWQGHAGRGVGNPVTG